MKQIIGCMIAVIALTQLTACKNCAQCHSQIMGVSSPAQEYCGDELEKVKTLPTMVCE